MKYFTLLTVCIFYFFSNNPVFSQIDNISLNNSEKSMLVDGLNWYARAITISGTNVYVGGEFTTAGGILANGIAKWNGSVWSALGSGLNGAVMAIAVNGNDVYVGGYFDTAGGIPANRIDKWNASKGKTIDIS